MTRPGTPGPTPAGLRAVFCETEAGISLLRPGGWPERARPRYDAIGGVACIVVLDKLGCEVGCHEAVSTRAEVLTVLGKDAAVCGCAENALWVG